MNLTYSQMARLMQVDQPRARFRVEPGRDGRVYVKALSPDGKVRTNYASFERPQVVADIYEIARQMANVLGAR